MRNEVSCPGCGRSVWINIETEPTTGPIGVEFEFDDVPGGRYAIFATLHGCERGTDAVIETRLYGRPGSSASDDDRWIPVNEYTVLLHECRNDGGSSDREPRAPLPSPPREESAERTP